MYRKSGIKGGHIILLNSVDSEYYEATKEQAVKALEAYPQGLQVGGGITADNAMEFIDAGAAAVIVTSYVFKDGRINYANLSRLNDTVGSDRLVLDLSCRKKDGQYYIVTDRWQNFTDEGRVAYKGTLEDTVFQLVGGIRSGMGYCGCKTIEDLKENGKFVKITAASLRESHPHDIHITKEAPNYSTDDK
jgi:phosphoribosylformimino-5-aminoimidazole carboxamide ribonucleotide (ProFAR) isomerase